MTPGVLDAILNTKAPVCLITFAVRGRRSGEAAKGTRKRSLWAVPLDGKVRRFVAE
jgi:hypothetical protein